MLPFAVGLHQAHAGPFQILEFPDQVRAGVVFIEGPARDTYENQSDVDLYKDALADVANRALDPDTSREIVHRYELQHAPPEEDRDDSARGEFKESSFCSGGDCVEVGMLLGGAVAVRGTRDRRHDLSFGSQEWTAFVAEVEHIPWMARPLRNQVARKEVYDSMALRCIERRKREETPP